MLVEFAAEGLKHGHEGRNWQRQCLIITVGMLRARHGYARYLKKGTLGKESRSIGGS